MIKTLIWLWVFLKGWGGLVLGGVYTLLHGLAASLGIVDELWFRFRDYAVYEVIDTPILSWPLRVPLCKSCRSCWENIMVNKSVNKNVNRPVPSWGEALKDAQERVKEAERELRHWKSVAAVCRRCISRGEPWPGAESGEEGSCAGR